VVDAGDPSRDEQVEAVENILDSLELMQKPRMMVWNKADLLDQEEVESLLRTRGGVAISAARREGLSTLLAKADTTLFAEGASQNLGVVADDASLPLELATEHDSEELEELPEEAAPTLWVG
jgi:GTP-binding protein HflX